MVRLFAFLSWLLNCKFSWGKNYASFSKLPGPECLPGLRTGSLYRWGFWFPFLFTVLSTGLRPVLGIKRPQYIFVERMRPIEMLNNS
jgi:hypothetical protein